MTDIDLNDIDTDVSIVEVNPRLAKHPLVFNGRLANRGLTSLVKESTWPATANDSLTSNYLDENYFDGHHIFHYQMGRKEIHT